MDYFREGNFLQIVLAITSANLFLSTYNTYNQFIQSKSNINPHQKLLQNKLLHHTVFITAEHRCSSVTQQILSDCLW